MSALSRRPDGRSAPRPARYAPAVIGRQVETLEARVRRDPADAEAWLELHALAQRLGREPAALRSRDAVAGLLAAGRLAPGGEILFAANARELELDTGGLKGWEVEEVTARVTPFDFERRPRVRAWWLRPGSGRRSHGGRAAP